MSTWQMGVALGLLVARALYIPSNTFFTHFLQWLRLVFFHTAYTAYSSDNMFVHLLNKDSTYV